MFKKFVNYLIHGLTHVLLGQKSSRLHASWTLAESRLLFCFHEKGEDHVSKTYDTTLNYKAKELDFVRKGESSFKSLLLTLPILRLHTSTSKSTQKTLQTIVEIILFLYPYQYVLIRLHKSGQSSDNLVPFLL